MQRFLKPEECEKIIGHAPGGVCPFGINDGVKVYLGESLKSMDSVLLACGTSDTGVELTIPELEKASCSAGWVDITKTPSS
ncbi:YbaK/EbsC family protein [Parasutterella sp.]|uniref:YbaK/EbsC family protein n=1 Tax=Parasutterella sp. TaxID=2049037 RepID=UPI00352299FB